MSADDQKKHNKDMKKVKTRAKKYDAFLASDILIKQIHGLLGSGLNKVKIVLQIQFVLFTSIHLFPLAGS